MRSAATYKSSKAVAWSFATCLIFGVMAPLSAQTVANNESIFAPPDRSLLQALNSSRELLEDGRYTDAFGLLTTVLEAESDYFFVPAQSDIPLADRKYQSLKHEASRILDGMSRAAQDAYEIRFGAIARKLLDDAVSESDLQKLSLVQRRYLPANAGHDARYRLGTIFLDQGRFGQAAKCFQTLLVSRKATRFEPYLSLKLAICGLRTGEPARAEAVLVDLQRRFPDARLQLRGQTVPLFQRSDDALVWLQGITDEPLVSATSRSEAWPMFRKDPARLARGNEPIGMLTPPRWRQPVSQSIEVELTLQAQREEFSRAATPALPSALPLAIDKTIVMRTPQRLAAMDFETGKLIWTANLPDSPTLLAPASPAAPLRSAPAARLAQRMWYDKTFGSLSSDGNAVFALEGFGVLPGPNENRNGVAGRFPDAANPGTAFNVLSAYDLRSNKGKPLWSINIPGNDTTGFGQPFFLGAPLPLDGDLYCLVEVRDEVRLIVLDADDGQLLWSQSLALAKPQRADARLRRTSGISPSFASGILICPTGSGAVVAVDLLTRSLLWAREYASPVAARQTVSANNTWADACAVVSGQHVVITPTESTQMHCLDLRDGTRKWSLDRGDLVFLACVDRDLAIAAGSRELMAIELKTGKVAPGWPVKFPEGSLPSGRGYASGGKYYLPMNVNGGGEVVAIQFDPPAIRHRSQWPAGTIPGNLISHRGHVLSQSADTLDSVETSTNAVGRHSSTAAP